FQRSLVTQAFHCSCWESGSTGIQISTETRASATNRSGVDAAVDRLPSVSQDHDVAGGRRTSTAATPNSNMLGKEMQQLMPVTWAWNSSDTLRCTPDIMSRNIGE